MPWIAANYAMRMPDNYRIPTTCFDDLGTGRLDDRYLLLTSVKIFGSREESEVSLYFHIYGWLLILGYFGLSKGEWVPRRG